MHFLDVKLVKEASFDQKSESRLDDTKIVTPYSRCTSEALNYKDINPNALIKSNKTRAPATCKYWVNISI